MQKVFVFGAIFFLLITGVYAQQDTTATGEVADAEIVIEKSKQIQFPVREKVNAGATEHSFTVEPLSLNFSPLVPDFHWPGSSSPVNPISPRPVEMEEIKRNYVLAGYGNFSSPVLGAGLHHKLNQISLDLDAGFESFGSGPVAGDNSASSMGFLDLSAKYQGSSFQLTPRVRYQTSGYQFYGNTDRVNTGFSSDQPVEASFNHVDFHVELNGSSKKLQYSATPRVFNTSQQVRNGPDINGESGFDFAGEFSLKIDSAFSAGLELFGAQSSYDGGLDYNRSLVTISPWVSRTLDDLSIRAGFTVASGEVGSFRQESDFYPFASVDWNFIPKWKLYGFFDSEVRWNDLNSLLQENQFLDDSLVILNTRMTSSFGGGIKGNPVDHLYLKGGIRLDNLRDLPFYVPSTTDSSRFSLDYDSGTINVFTVEAEASASLGTNFLSANLKIFNYGTKSLPRPWHLPTYRFTLTSSHKFSDELLVGTELIAEGGIKAPTNTTEGFVNLKAFADFNVYTNYQITDQIAVFFRANNLFSNEYEKYIGYPVRGLNFKLGGRYRF